MGKIRTIIACLVKKAGASPMWRAIGATAFCSTENLVQRPSNDHTKESLCGRLFPCQREVFRWYYAALISWK